MTPSATFGPRHAARGRFPRHTVWIALASVGGAVMLGYLGAAIADGSQGPSQSRTDAAFWAPTDSPTPGADGSAPQSLSTAPTSVPPSPTTSTPSPTRGTAAPSGTEICRLVEHGGTFYLYLTDAAARDLTACAGGTPFVGTIDQLLWSGSGMNRRCVLDPDHNARTDASVAVYSDRMRPDVSAARAYCDANGGHGGHGGDESN